MKVEIEHISIGHTNTHIQIEAMFVLLIEILPVFVCSYHVANNEPFYTADEYAREVAESNG